MVGTTAPSFSAKTPQEIRTFCVTSLTPSFSASVTVLHEEASHCNNVSRLRAYADRAEALKLRLLNELDQMAADIARKKAEEEERKRKEAEAKGEKPDIPAEPPKPLPKVKKKKRVAIKSVTLTSSWRLETEEDIEKYLASLRENLKAQLEEDTIVNIEF